MRGVIRICDSDGARWCAALRSEAESGSPRAELLRSTTSGRCAAPLRGGWGSARSHGLTSRQGRCASLREQLRCPLTGASCGRAVAAGVGTPRGLPHPSAEPKDRTIVTAATITPCEHCGALREVASLAALHRYLRRARDPQLKRVVQQLARRYPPYQLIALCPGCGCITAELGEHSH